MLTKIAAREHSKAELGHIIIRVGRRLCSTQRALVVRAADGELVVVLGERLQAIGFNL